MPLGTVTISGDDTFTLYSRIFADFANDAISELTFPEERVAMATGKNGNSVYTRNEQGLNGDLTIRLIRGSADDRFLIEKMAEMERDFAGIELADGSLVKRLGDGQGNVLSDVYSLSGGIISKIPDTQNNTSGDVEQAVVTYNLKIAVVTRSVG